MRFLVSLFIATALSASAFAASDSAKAQAELNKAKELLANGQVGESIVQAKAATHDDANNAEAFFVLAAATEKEGDGLTPLDLKRKSYSKASASYERSAQLGKKEATELAEAVNTKIRNMQAPPPAKQ